MRATYVSRPAHYVDSKVPRFKGNPFIECLPSLGSNASEILDSIKNYPDVPTDEQRLLSDMDRMGQLNCIKDIVYPFAAYGRAAKHFAANMPEVYVARNPLQAIDRQRRMLIADSGVESVSGGKATARILVPSDWKSTASGQALFGGSGSGKTTLVNKISLPFQIVIEHKMYKGKKLRMRQVPLLKLRTPHDATLKSLCLQFFQTIDAILGNTEYLKQARTARSVAQMTLLMAQVSTTVSLGKALVDEIQNLKAARGPQAEFVLNLFSELIEHAGVGLCVIGTPAVLSVAERNVRNLRKLTTGASYRFDCMKFGDTECDAFYDKYWEYQYVRNPIALSPTIRKAWWDASGGNPAFTALAYLLAQRIEIGGSEKVDEVSFQRVANMEMAVLQPAIRALKSGNAKALAEFEDLVFKPGIRDLLDIIGYTSGSSDDSDPEDELDDVADAATLALAKAEARAAKQGLDKKAVKALFDDLPTENPLQF